MRIFEPHIHMYARTTQDYEDMARAGIEMLVEPAFWLGETRKYAGSFFDYFDHLINYEHTRAARYGIQQYVTIAMNPKESNNVPLAQAIIAELPRYLEHPRVVAVGEMGFDRITPEEEDSFLRQAELAREFQLPLLVHTPHINKHEGIERMIQLLRERNFDFRKVLMDHNVEETTPVSKAAGCWCNHSVYSITKLTPERMVNILEQHGIERMLTSSAADWGPSDPLSVPRVIDEMRSRGFSEKQIETVVWNNPLAFFSQSGKVK